MKIYLSKGVLLISTFYAQFAPCLLNGFLFSFTNLRNPRACYTSNEAFRTKSERISRQKLPRHERENRILQNVPWHARTWPVKHKRWPTKHIRFAATPSPRHLAATAHQYRLIQVHSLPSFTKTYETRKTKVFMYETEFY